MATTTRTKRGIVTGDRETRIVCIVKIYMGAHDGTFSCLLGWKMDEIFKFYVVRALPLPQFLKEVFKILNCKRTLKIYKNNDLV